MALKPSDSVRLLRGVGVRRGVQLSSIGIESVGDLLRHAPSRYEDRRTRTEISALEEGRPAVVCGVVRSVRVLRTNRANVRAAALEVEDGSGAVSAVVFGGFAPGGPAAFRSGAGIILFGVPSVPARRGRNAPLFEFKSPEYELIPAPDGNFGVLGALGERWRRILPVYPSTEGLPRSTLAEIIRRCAASPDLAVEDPLPREVIERRSLMPLIDAYRGIHLPSTFEEIDAARRRLAYQEFWEIRVKFAAYRAKRARLRATPLTGGRDMLGRFLASLPFDLTSSQSAALSDISRDLDGPVPMRRILIGDVGSGKTAVAMSAIAKCAGASMQAAVLVPTTILSSQFYGACVQYLSPLGITIAELSGMSGGVTAAARERREKLERSLGRGEIDVLVGTHALFGFSAAFKSLGLLVIDEQHRFGVSQRARLAEANGGAHVLMMSATPIPRTLSMALYGHLDMSEIRGLPPGRRGVKTRVMSDNHIVELYSFMADYISRTRARCYWVCPSIGDESSDGDRSAVLARARDIEFHIPGIPVLRLYGAMRASEKGTALRSFQEGEPGVLVSTTVIEVGVDVRDACLMVIEGAARYGLAALHQMRGRVGRGSRAGICILLDSAPNIKNSRRLSVLLECSDGFEIAEEDLKLRGAGEMMGIRQHGDLNFRFADMARDGDLMEAAAEDADLGL